MANSSRVKKFKELRESIKEEAGINHEVIMEENTTEEEDDFLSFVNKMVDHNKADESKTLVMEDTITEAKTFEQLSEESNEEIDKALKSAKSNVGKEEHHNTRLDILNKIRNPEKEVIKIDTMENMSTEQFAKGYFINKEKEDTQEESEKENIEAEKPVVNNKQKMTLMERLAAMSPKEDVEKAEKDLQLQKEEIEEKVENEELTQELEENPITNVTISKNEVSEEASEEINSQDQKVLTILNYAIIVLIAIFVVICIMIVYQIFF